ncbi:MAG: hypothetical protein KC449_23485 [Anaerolineales bacterium]|nr:hypothetical protein [Anaerolineales bacterium]
MRPTIGLPIENAELMSEMERLEAAFMKITDVSIGHIKNDLEAARAMGNEEAKKVYHIQISMFQHAQSIFAVAKRFATDRYWQNEQTTA